MQVHSGPNEAHQLHKVGSHGKSAASSTRVNLDTTVGHIDYDGQIYGCVGVIVDTEFPKASLAGMSKHLQHELGQQIVIDGSHNRVQTQYIIFVPEQSLAIGVSEAKKRANAVSLM